MKCKSICSI